MTSSVAYNMGERIQCISTVIRVSKTRASAISSSYMLTLESSSLFEMFIRFLSKRKPNLTPGVVCVLKTVRLDIRFNVIVISACFVLFYSWELLHAHFRYDHGFCHSVNDHSQVSRRQSITV